MYFFVALGTFFKTFYKIRSLTLGAYKPNPDPRITNCEKPDPDSKVTARGKLDPARKNTNCGTPDPDPKITKYRKPDPKSGPSESKTLTSRSSKLKFNFMKNFPS